MRRLIPILLTFLVTAGGAFALYHFTRPAAPAPGANDARDLTGTWFPVGGERAGKPLEKEFVTRAILTFEGDRLYVDAGFERFFWTVKAIDWQKSPAEMRLADAGPERVALVKVSADELTLCVPADGDKSIPVSFDTPGTKHMTLRLTRLRSKVDELLAKSFRATPTAIITGTVTLQGNPLTGGSVHFYPVQDGAVYSAAIQADGTFALGGSNEGPPAGRYKVTVQSDVQDRKEGGENAHQGIARPADPTDPSGVPRSRHHPTPIRGEGRGEQLPSGTPTLNRPSLGPAPSRS